MSKISICCGGVSVEFDGTEEFIKQELIGLVSKVAKLVSTTPSVGPLGDHENKFVSSKSGLNLSTKTIYSKLGEESGRGRQPVATMRLATAATCLRVSQR